MPVMGVAKFEHFFRAAAGLDVSKNDLKRYSDFVDAKLYDLFVIGTANAKANDRDVIQPQDLPVTKGLQESIHAFKKLDEEIELRPCSTRSPPAPPSGWTPPRRPKPGCHCSPAASASPSAAPSRRSPRKPAVPPPSSGTKPSSSSTS